MTIYKIYKNEEYISRRPYEEGLKLGCTATEYGWDDDFENELSSYNLLTDAIHALSNLRSKVRKENNCYYVTEYFLQSEEYNEEEDAWYSVDILAASPFPRIWEYEDDLSYWSLDDMIEYLGLDNKNCEIPKREVIEMFLIKKEK